MNLLYDGKKPINEIWEHVRKNQTSLISKEPSLLIKDDNFVALSNLLPKYKSKIDLIYIDPPFNTKSVFTISKDRSATISRSNSGIVAYEDNLPIEEYLEFLRERLLLLHDLLSDEGSIYLHIDTKIGHYVKIIMDEIFGEDNFVNDISRIKSNPKNFSRKAYGNEKDMILFYSKIPRENIFNNIAIPLSNKDILRLFPKQDSNGRRYTTVPCHAPGETKNGPTGQKWKGMLPPKGRHWRSSPKELTRLDEKGLIEWSKTGNPRIIKYLDCHKGKKIQDIWEYKDPQYPKYPTQKNLDMLEMIVLQSSNESSIVLDCFCGSGSTLIAAEKHRRKWIGIDQSEVSIDLILKDFSNVDFTYLLKDSNNDYIMEKNPCFESVQLEISS